MPCCAPVEAATFAKAKNVFRAVQATSPQKAGPSQRELRAQLRAERIKQGKAGRASADRGHEEADLTELEAAASLVDLMAHEGLQPGKHPSCVTTVKRQDCRCISLALKSIDQAANQ